MALVQASRRVAAPADRAWSLVTDWSAHGRWIPLTVVTVDPAGPQSGVGTRFVGRTALGPVGFDDPMVVREWEPPADGRPGRCRIDHRGPWVAGWAEITVTPETEGSRVEWREDIYPRWTPRVADPAVRWIGKVLFDGTLRKLAAELAG